MYLDRGAYLYNSPESGQMGLYTHDWMYVPKPIGNFKMLIRNNFSENPPGSIELVIYYMMYRQTNNIGS